MTRVRAPELVGRGGWIGASPGFGLASAAGKVLVLHFWTSSCINCVRVLDELRPIEDRFSSSAIVAGIHSPKFPHEHEHASVERAVERLGIRHPVLDDPDLTTWKSYGVKGWPTVVVIDPEGYVVGGIAGEGSGPVVYATVEQAVSDHDARGTLVRGPALDVWGPVPMPASVGSLTFPGKVDVDADGRRLAIADTGGGRVVVCDLDGRVDHVYPLFTRPQGVAFDGGRVVVCDTGADRVVAVDRASGSQTVLAEGLASPWDVTVAGDGSLLVAEAGRHRLWRVPAGGGQAVVVAGTGQENLIDTGEDGSNDALLAQPSGVAALPDGGAVFVDAEASALRVLRGDGSVVTLVGQGLFDWGASDGGPDSAALQHPMGVAVDPRSGEGPPDVYIADAFNSMVRVWTGDAWNARSGALRTLPVKDLDEPGGLAILPDGRLVIADTNHHRVVVVEPGATTSVPIVLDETWMETATGDPIDVGPGAVIRVPFDLDPGSLCLDPSVGPPVRIDVWAAPPTLLAPGARRWARANASGTVEVVAGLPGQGVLVVEVELSVCDDEQCSVLRARSRSDLRVASPVPPGGVLT